jgi:hypothetical protein
MCKSGQHRANRVEEPSYPELKLAQIFSISACGKPLELIFNTTSNVQPLELIKVKFTGPAGGHLQRNWKYLLRNIGATTEIS